jgi:2-dehydro-3-deoxyglucarate aldolase
MNKLKKSLNDNKVTMGSWIQIPDPAIVEIMVCNCCNKLDWICIDIEHGSIGIKSMINLIRTIERFDIVPVVRIPKNDYIWIHRTLDAGAKGIIIPMINTKEEAVFAISESRYPPFGKRSFGYSRSNFYGSDFNESVKKSNDEISVILQIENIEAINNLEEILLLDGFDGTFIGPYDLSGSMGILGDFDNDKFNNVLNKYLRLSDKYNKPAGVHIVNPTNSIIKTNLLSGYKTIAIGIDTVFLANKVKEIFNEL